MDVAGKPPKTNDEFAGIRSKSKACVGGLRHHFASVKNPKLDAIKPSPIVPPETAPKDRVARTPFKSAVVNCH